MSDHHPFSPSSLERLAICPGSYKLSLGVQREDNEYSTEGTMLHECVEKNTPNLETLTPEQSDIVQRCISELEKHAPHNSWLKEQHVSVLSDFEILTAGTVDAVLILDEKILALDWKVGFTPVQKAKENMQAKAYAAALMQKYGLPVEFCMFQPRINNISSHTFDIEELDDIISQIKTIIDEAKGQAMLLNPDKKACQYCAAKNICPATQKALESTDLAKIEHTSELTTEQIGSYLVHWQTIKRIGTNLENQAKLKLQQGEEINGWFLKPMQGRKEVTDINKVYEIASQFVNLEQFLKCVTISIPELEDFYKRNKKEIEGGKLTDHAKVFTESIAPYIQRKSDYYILTQNKNHN